MLQQEESTCSAGLAATERTRYSKHFEHLTLEARTQKVDKSGQTLDQLIEETLSLKCKKTDRVSAKEWAKNANPFVEGEACTSGLALKQGEEPTEAVANCLAPLLASRSV